MSEPISRRVFTASVVTGALASAVPSLGQAPQQPAAPQDEQRDYPAPTFKPKHLKPVLGSTLVQDFVIFGHYDLDMVKLLLKKQPSVLNATMDWGAGDWETALGGASHMGRRDIALYLIEQGARPDIFTATMLGHTDVVKSLITSHPPLADAKGPHGIPLIAHAKMGGKEAEETLAYLTSLKKA